MRKAALIACVVLGLLCGFVASPDAAGLYDGIWSVTITGPGGGVSFASLTQNDSFVLSLGFNLVIIDVTFGDSWGAGTGLLTGQTAYGALYNHDPNPNGNFTITFSDTNNFSGSGILNGAPITIKGVKIF